MKKRRHHNNHALTSTKRGKRKKEIAQIAKRLRRPIPDSILRRPEEEPGYGHGV